MNRVINPVAVNHALGPKVVRGRRDSSLDSGIHHPLSDTSSSDQDDLSEAVNNVRLSPVGCNETDNLVEEVYVSQLNTKSTENVDDVESLNTSHKSLSDDSLSENVAKKPPSRVYIAPENPIPPPIIHTNTQNNEEPVKEEADRKEVKEKEREPIIEEPEGILEEAESLAENEDMGEKFEAKVVVAVDLGTTYSGYAYRYIDHPSDVDIHLMSNCQGEPGLNNQKLPSILLLDPSRKLHSFGCTARDHFHDLDPAEAHLWLYFDKFKLTLHNNTDVSRESMIRASNGCEVNALTVFSQALYYLKSQALGELQHQADSSHVQWVITVPAIWSHTAKQFVREAAYMAGMFESHHPEQLLIALEPEAAAIWCRNLRTSLIQDDQSNCDNCIDNQCGLCYMVVDCGGGTVDITVHRVDQDNGSLQELHKATGGSCGSLGVDEEFNRVLGGIFGFGFMSQLQVERPAAYTELMLSFESRKRSASPLRHLALNISPPYAFIDYFRKVTGKEVETVVQNYGKPEVSWSTQGQLRIHPSLMTELFRPTIERVIQHIEKVLSSPRVLNKITHLYLVGGFAESQILQQSIRDNFAKRLKVIIPQGVALSVLRGAVLFGLNPTTVSVRQARHTYGIGVLRKFIDGVHPVEKLVVKDGQEWCVDVLDPLVEANQTLRVGEMVMRRYTPANCKQSQIVLNIYCAQSASAKYVTDHGVRRIGTLKLDLRQTKTSSKQPREIIARLTFGGTEVTASAYDTASKQYVDTDLSFLT
ncbi:heat shock 70 kDa protein 12A isoform X2 [Nilaparvata lugens]|uniref:heat shock 70 kDa protein 12A isoform X2 n=1 Tax=Nilaparvata lugens TaxID=108931 RepID=UPI00193DC109|nr:heat shock 70 kDa protein 12A isoform X2 [Nilaparvata lugens]